MYTRVINLGFMEGTIMKKFFLTCMLWILFCSVAVAAQQKNDYVSPNFNPENIHSIIVIGQTPNEAIPYIVDDSLITSLPDEFKKECKISDVKIDTFMEAIVKVQNISGKNILAMSQSQDIAQKQEAYNILWNYINANYDTIVNISILQANYSQTYSEGYTYRTTETQRSTVSNIYGNIATINTPVEREHTVGRGFKDVAQVALNISVLNKNENVMNRKEFRNKISSGIAATTPYDMGRRIVASFAHDFNKKMQLKQK